MKSIPMRDGYGEALLELCEKNPKVIALDADVANSTRSVWVRDRFPEQFIDMGISEQDMVGTAAGMALGGMVPFVSTYCVFLAGRAWDQIRTTVCYNNLNVKFGGAHAGISVGPDGAQPAHHDRPGKWQGTRVFWHGRDQHQKMRPPGKNGGACRSFRHIRTAANVPEADAG